MVLTYPNPDREILMRHRRVLVGLALPVVMATLAAACGGGSSNASSANTNTTTPKADTQATGGDIPDTQAYIAYSPPTGSYVVKVPEGWARTDSPTGVTFTDNLNTIRIDAAPAAGAPDVTSVRNGEVSTLRATNPGFQLHDVATVQRAAGTAVLVTYLDDGPANAVTGKRDRQAVQRYEFWRNGTQVTMTLVSPVGADNVDPWRKVTDSFAWQG
jgi:hypothetical protein